MKKLCGMAVLFTCAWVLWGWDGGSHPWYPMAGYDDRKSCVVGQKEAYKETPKQHFKCLPDTVKP